MSTHSPRLLDAFSRARQRAAGHMADSEKASFTWGEETVTDLLLVAASPEVRAFPFTKRQEGGEKGTGADWLWWWIGDGGQSFGALIQAKRLKKERNGRWKLDFDYNEGKQRTLLMSAAEALQVAPTYALYMGSPYYRYPVKCMELHHPDDFGLCDRCVRKTISLLPALLLTPGGGITEDPEWAYQLAVPLEDLADADHPVSAVPLHLNLELDLDLALFLFTTQDGPKKVAKALVQQIRYVRGGQLELASYERVEFRSADFTFPSLPNDRGHMSEAYFPNVLRGLRNSPPGYVLELLANDDPETSTGHLQELDEMNLAGVVIVDQRTD